MGAPRLAFDDDGRGMAYYASGRVAACVCAATPYSSCFYFYKDDRKNTPLCTIDDKACGFADGKDGSRFVLSKKGGIHSDGEGTIKREWTWGEGNKPPLVTLKINDALTLEFVDRDSCEVRLRFAGTKGRDFDVGLKEKRKGSYLDTCTRRVGGALDPQITRVSLSQRVAEVGLKSQALRNTMHPKSGVLTNAGTRSIVAALEAGFDDYDSTHNPGATFRGHQAHLNSQMMTRAEVPRISLTGAETGPTHGLGDTIYGASLMEPATTLKLTSGDLQFELNRMNPTLKRSQMIRGASGRFSDQIPVYGGVPTVTNPTGKAESGRVALPVIAPDALEAYVSSSGDALVCVACVRHDDPTCCKAEAVAQSARGAISRKEVRDSTKYDLVKVEMSASRVIADRYNVYALPAFLMFYRGKLVYAGQLGGEKIRVASEFKPYKMLYVEPTFSDMRYGEKLLRKLRFSWDLCSSAAEAGSLKAVADRAAVAKGERKAAYDVVLVADSLSEGDAAPLQRLFKQDALVIGLAALKGEAGAKAVAKARFTSKRQGLTKDVDVVLPSHVASIADYAMTKPMKGAALEDLLDVLGERRQALSDADGAPSQDLDYRGLTVKALLRQCYSALQAGQRGASIADPSKQGKRKKIPLQKAYPVTKKWTFPPPAHDAKIEGLIDLSYRVAGQ